MVLSKGEKTRQLIIESAFTCIGRDGVHKTNFQTIADECGMSPARVVKVFGQRKNIFLQTLNHLYEEAVSKTEESFSRLPEQASLQELLASYLDVSFVIFHSRPFLPQFYMSLYYLSVFDSEIQRANTEIKKQAVTRIQSIFERATPPVDFSAEESELLAKRIHNILTGFLLNEISEEKKYSQEEYQVLLKRTVAEILRGREIEN